MKPTVKMILTGCLVFSGILTIGMAGEDHDMTPYNGSQQFERMKKLSGKWEATSSKPNEPKATVEYQVTSGGSALVEKLFSGTPHEMVSVYHDKGGKLCMTHYCMLHNQPQMELKSGDDRKLEFVLAKVSGINPKEPHMHALTVLFNDDDHITQKWVSFEKGKEKESFEISLTRVR